MKLKLEQESKVGRINISGSSLMPVKDMFAVDTMTSQQLRIVKYTATKLLIGLLADQSLVSQVMLMLPLHKLLHHYQLQASEAVAYTPQKDRSSLCVTA